MAKSKTKRCTVEFSCLDTDMSLPIEIGPRQFEAQRDYLIRQVVATANNEIPMTHRASRTETETCVTHLDVFTVGTADTILTQVICKKGFVFKT